VRHTGWYEKCNNLMNSHRVEGSMHERIREKVSGALKQDDLERRMAEGWRLVALEWERETEQPAGSLASDVPFGLKVAGDCAHLEENPDEREVLVAMMELTIQDGPYSSIAEELNRRGLRTREGLRWTPVSVFQMLPRLIEVGPKIFSSEEWQKRREKMQQAPHR
jgi:Recombinase